MRRLLFLALVCAAASVQAQTTPTAGTVYVQCRQLTLNPSPAPEALATAVGLCTFLLRGFVDGFVAGSRRGVRTAFISDAQNLATTKGINDLQSRVSLVSPKAQCLPPAATLGQVAEVFIRYLDAHPQRSSELYPEPLIDAMEEYFCPR